MSAILKTPALNFRPMQVADLNDVLEIERASYQYPWTRAIFSDCLQAGYSCWVCEQGGSIQGYGVLSAAAGESHLLNLCVRTDARQQGVGRKILTQMIAIARRHDAEIMFLEVRPSNMAARALYESAEFSELGDRRDYYPRGRGREDALILARTL